MTHLLNNVETAIVLKSLLHASSYITDSAITSEIGQAIRILNGQKSKPTGGSKVCCSHCSAEKQKQLWNMFGLK